MKNYVPKDGRGFLTANKKTKETHPDYKGKIMIDGKSYKLAAWVKTTQYGNLISLSLDNFTMAAERGPVEREVTSDQDVPFN